MQDGAGPVESAICRSTIIPNHGSDKEAVSAQPSSLGDSLVRITTDGDSLNMTNRMKQTGFPLIGNTFVLAVES